MSGGKSGLEGRAGGGRRGGAGGSGGSGSRSGRSNSRSRGGDPPAVGLGTLLGGPGARPMTAPRFLALVGLFVLGLLTGVAGALVQAGWFPGGLLLAVAGIGALCFGGVRATGGRSGGAVPAGGWLVAIVLLLTTRPEGDFLFGAGAGSYLFLLGAVVVVMCTTLPRPPDPAAKEPRRPV